MKTLHVLLFTIFVASANSAFARLGETRQQIDKRYGEGHRSDIQRMEGAETIKYHFNNFQVEVVFHDDKSIWEIFSQGNVIKLPDIKMLLKANTPGASSWHYDGMNDRWERSGDAKAVGFLWRGHEDYFCIQDVKACEDMHNGDAADLNGF
jgi:hypothetical protein